MAGRTGSKSERSARRARVAAAVERGDSPSVIARAEDVSERQAPRLVAEVRNPKAERELSHALRRSFASWLIAEGEDVSYVMDQMGHADSKTRWTSTRGR